MFYAFRVPKVVKDWNTTFAPVPDNYILLDPNKGDDQIPLGIDFDLVLSHNKFGQFQIAARLARALHLPLVSLDHTLPPNSYTEGQLADLKQMRGHVNVFISEYSREKWGWKEDEAEVVHHGIDTEVFSPCDCEDCKTWGTNDWKLIGDHCCENRKCPHLLSVVNDWKNRDWCCGFRLWQQVTHGLPTRPVGDTPGLSKPAVSVEALVNEYRSAAVFLNTSLISPVPTALLEAMACGCAVVSTATCMIPEIIENGVNGFLSNDPEELAGYCRTLLGNAALCRKLGDAARQTIVEKFSMNAFVNNWNRVFADAASHFYKGE
jgi:glycosyltransferase involved in cell wall biosynthesis